MKDLRARNSGNSYKANQSVRVTREEILEAKGAEKENYKHMMDIMRKERDRLKKRLGIVGDPSYSLSVRKKIMDIKDQIQCLEEAKRKLKSNKFGRQIKMNKVISAGQNDAMMETHEKVKELTCIFDRVHKINKKLESELNTKAETDDTLSKLQQKLSKLESEAEEKGYDIHEIYNKTETDPDTESAPKDPEFYNRKMKILE
jgi:hypothetical protein